MKQQLKTNSIKLSNEILLGSVVELIKSGRKVKINISGSSMIPFLYDGQTILLSDIDMHSIRLGDIVLGRYRDAFVLHRVVRKKDDFIYIAGDNNLNQIERIPSNDIYAVALELYRADKVIKLRGTLIRIRGFIWYCLRPLRKVYARVSRLFNKDLR